MKKKIFGVVLTLSLLLSFSSIMPAFASKIQPPAVYLQLTTDPHYDRNPSLFEAKDGTWWLFFTRATSGGIRELLVYDPDSDSYDIYYKTAQSLLGLQTAEEHKVPGSDSLHGQRDVAAMQASDGKIWVFSSPGFGPGENHIYYFTYESGTWQGPEAVDIVEPYWIGHISVLEFNQKIWLFYDAEYSLKSAYYDDGSWYGPFDIVADATLGKAIVDNGIFYIVWAYLNQADNLWGSYIGLSTSTNGITWANHGKIASWPAEGTTNWDPVLVKENRYFRLLWAPDVGDEGQFIATSISRNPTAPTSWSDPVRVTTANYETESWWDFWPQPIAACGNALNPVFLVYTSERSSDGTSMIDGNIWLRIAFDL